MQACEPIQRAILLVRRFTPNLWPQTVFIYQLEQYVAPVVSVLCKHESTSGIDAKPEREKSIRLLKQLTEP